MQTTKKSKKDFVKELCEDKGYSYRDLVREGLFNNVTKAFRYCKTYSIKTIYSNEKNEDKKQLNTLSLNDLKNLDGVIDLSCVSIVRQKGKHKRDIGDTLIGYIDIRSKRVFINYIKDLKQNKVTENMVITFLEYLKIKFNLKIQTIGCDSEFPNLPYKIGKVANWNCSKSYIEKCFGIKNKILQYLNIVKEIMGLTNKELLTTHKEIVRRIYLEILKRHKETFTLVLEVNNTIPSKEKKEIMVTHRVTNKKGGLIK